MPAPLDVSGQRFGRLTAVQRVGKRNGHTLWLCKCDCGNETKVVLGSLRSGLTQSCGCFDAERRIKHGETRTRLYQVWLGMRQRCNYPKHRDFANYGGRGIKVCASWFDDFGAFRDWAMNSGYDPEAPYMRCTIDRIDPDGDYEPDNCRWVDAGMQANNRRNSRKAG